MEHSSKASSSKHHRSHKDNHEHHSKKRRKSERDEEHSKKKKKRKERKADTALNIVDHDSEDNEMWEEKNIDMGGEQDLAANIPTAESLKLTSRAVTNASDPPLPTSTIVETKPKRDDWMLDPTVTPTIPDFKSRLPVGTPDGDMSMDTSPDNAPSGAVLNTPDFFSSLGTELRPKPPLKNPDQDKPKYSSRELNTSLRDGGSIDDMPTTERKFVPGGPGSQWRMMKLRRVYATAEEEGKSVEEVALERFDSIEAFEEAKEERRILDEREGKRTEGGSASAKKDRGRNMEGERRYMFTDVERSGASSRSSSFRRPDVGDSIPSTPTPSSRMNARGSSLNPAMQNSAIRQESSSVTRTPIPSVMTPSHALPGPSKSRAMSPSSLNKLQAKVLRAKLMSAPNADELEKEYEAELQRANGGGDDEQPATRVEVVPTLDGQGRLYDIGMGKDDPAPLPGNRKKKEKVETRDPKTGDLVRINADDDDLTLGELLRQERFGAGSADQKNLDAEYARAIMTDTGFKNDLDYMDDNVEKLARKKMRSDAMKRQFAINDYKRTQQALATCPHCFGEDDSPPKAPVVAMGTRVYLSCTLHEELVEGHCLIVPIQHHLTMLEGDDDVWDEAKNFMKCLMRMFAEQDKGVLFYETVISLKWQKHTVIECVPIPWEQFEDIPAYFKESILMSEGEWSQHKKLIDFSSRPGGFRRAMVPNLPYFMVQFDYKGERGYGHVIEGTDKPEDENDAMVDETMGTGSDFPRYFAAEIIGNVLEVEPRRWRRPRRVDFHNNKARVAKFKKMYDQFDWTGLIGKS
ncbi:hypothetical protein QCA50_014604 [Cerrena zonata]|uniref:Uncharacterized protein n=1 Tax=Cerrena zonata TaxID=2478898 RepID=A0AAW0FTP3_9APHY